MRKWKISPFFSAKSVVKSGVKFGWKFPCYVFQGLGVRQKISRQKRCDKRKISRKFRFAGALIVRGNTMRGKDPQLWEENATLERVSESAPGDLWEALWDRFSTTRGPLRDSLSRSARKGRQQMGETGFCKNLRFSAVSCENLRFPAVFCANLQLPNPLIYRVSRESAKICKNLRKCAFRVRFSPFCCLPFSAPWRVSETPQTPQNLSEPLRPVLPLVLLPRNLLWCFKGSAS